MQNKIQALPDGSQMTKLDVSTCFLTMASLTAISQQLPEGSAAGLLTKRLGFSEGGHCHLDRCLCHLAVTG